MGIWPKYADGTDINALDVCSELGIIATADDSGFLNVLNFPSVVEEAPRRTYSGHSSFVQNVRFLPPPVQTESGLDQRLVRLQLHSARNCSCSCVLVNCVGESATTSRTTHRVAHHADHTVQSPHTHESCMRCDRQRRWL